MRGGIFGTGTGTGTWGGAMKHAVIAGPQGYLAGRRPRRMYASASSPMAGLI